MANYVFGTTGAGRVGEYVNRVLNNDPSTALLRVIPVSTSLSAEAAEANLTWAAAITAGFVEQVAASWGRKDLTDTGQGLAWAWDATNNRNGMDFTDLVWTAPLTGNNTTGIVICYDGSGASTNAQLIPLVHLDMAVTADGNQVTYQVNAAGAYTATRV